MSSSSLSKKRTLFIKPSRAINQIEKLDAVRVGINKHHHNIETTLILDTNILIAMEKVVKNGNKHALLKEFALHNLVKLLQQCPPQSICLAAGNALKEMPPGIAEESRMLYEQFCSIHLPQFCDTPNAIYTKFEGKRKDYGFFDLEKTAQAVIASPFSNLIYLNLVYHTRQGTPLEKFNQYLKLIEEKIDIISLTELEIARYCFFRPTSEAKSFKEKCQSIRENFIGKKTPKTASDLLKVALNGAGDIQLLQTANVIDSNGVDDIKQDCWIATLDEKLSIFCEIFHHLDKDGNAGEIAVSDLQPPESTSNYWIKTSDLAKEKIQSRAHYHQTREIDLFALIDIAKEAIESAKLAFPETRVTI